jgi:hypothetical protein
MEDKNEVFRQALAAFYKAAVAFARRDEDKQEEHKRKEYVKRELNHIQGVFTNEWDTQMNPTGAGDCYPPCGKSWVCINGTCQPQTAYLGGESPAPSE